MGLCPPFLEDSRPWSFCAFINHQRTRSSIHETPLIHHSTSFHQALGTWLGKLSVGFSAPWFSRAQSSPNGQLRIAAIGTGGRAAANIAGVAHEHIAALCDVDQNLLGKASEKWPQAKRYQTSASCSRRNPRKSMRCW